MSRLIYADALKDSIEVHFADGIHMYDTFAELIDEQPTIEERKKGEWIEYIPEHGKCPFCGNQVDLLGGKANNFCGECGAEMRGEKE